MKPLWCNRVPQGALRRLEPDEGKLSSPVLRGGDGGNAISLLDMLDVDFLGNIVPRQDQRVWQDGPLAEAIQAAQFDPGARVPR